MIATRLARLAITAVLLLLSRAAFAQSPAETTYLVTIPEPAHHWLQVEVTFRELGSAPLRARMSQSSPGRYATHAFAKNIFALDAWDSQGRRLRTDRTESDEWQVAGHDGTVRIVYRIFGDRADGTYMAVDTTHAHLNGPATFLWALGLEARPIRVTFTPPDGSPWTVGTQLFPTADPLTFTAPNLQYFLDSPVEMAELVVSTFTVARSNGPPALFRIFVHATASQSQVDALAQLVRTLAVEQIAVFGDVPEFEPGHFTFLLDYMPWVDGDGMEHRNSTVITDPGVSLATPGDRLAALDSISHELFHVWNVERIRPADLEPFDFTRANVSCCLWLAEGFTQYYGPLLLRRAGLSNAVPLGAAVTVINGSGRSVRSAVNMSEQAPFADMGVSNDPVDRSRTYISYYTYGAAIALGLDLTLREKTSGRVTLDSYMQRLWQRYGAVRANAAGVVARPYTLDDLRRELGELVDDQAFADAFFARHVEGRDVIDYARLMALAGYVLRPAAAGRAWPGDVNLEDGRGGLLVGGRGGVLVGFGSPAYAAGLDAGDVIVSIDAQPATRASWNALTQRTVGDRVALVVERRDGRRDTTTLTLGADPALQIVPVEAGGTPSDEQQAFRAAWLGSRGQ